MDRKKTLLFFIVLITPLFLTAVFVVITDPFFHYHAPLKGYTYELSKERYQNDGIVNRHPNRDMLTFSCITGMKMAVVSSASAAGWLKTWPGVP